jgi:hypothetical protein
MLSTPSSSAGSNAEIVTGASGAISEITDRIPARDKGFGRIL